MLDAFFMLYLFHDLRIYNELQALKLLLLISKPICNFILIFSFTGDQVRLTVAAINKLK